jgi:hypothetical protein
MKKLSLYVFICAYLLACKKEEVVVINPATTKVTLIIDQVINDSTIVLKWPACTDKHFKQYKITRSADYAKNGLFGSYTEAIDSSTDASHTSFTEHNMPYAKSLFYYLTVLKDTPQVNPAAESGYAVYIRPNALFEGIATDAFLDIPQQRLYLTEQNKITVLNYASNRLLTSKQFAEVGIGFCSLGSYNGSTELYVPVNDGWVQILDAATLQLKDTIYVAGLSIGSVVNMNGKLYVSSSDQTDGSNSLKIYDRATRALIGRTGFGASTRLLPLPGGNNDMIDIPMNTSAYICDYYQFNANGSLLSKKQVDNSYSYRVDYNILRPFPDGSRFITSTYGAVFNKSLAFERYLKEYGNYGDFAFSADGSTIYAADTWQKKIDVYAYPAMTLTKSYATKYYAYKIFREGSTLICVSKINGSQMSYVQTEIINL